ncbi:MAG: hypothetical protein K1X95_09640 [Acidimicrobiia bacterium]|nr:hypothetical protein [Acidimicrobiia bacterium]
MAWLGQNPVILFLVAAVVVAVILTVGFMALRMLGAPVDEPASRPKRTEDVEQYDVRYRCIVCGAEVRLTRLASDGDDDFEPPKHCREEMQLVVEAEDPRTTPD